MGIREQLKAKKAMGLLVGFALIVCGAVAIGYQLVGGSGGVGAGPSAGASGEAYFSTDEGQTYFSDDASKLAPYDYKGKTAVRAYVFQCSGIKPFVGYVERFTPDALKAQQTLDSVKDAKPGPNGPRIDARMIQLAQTGREVKRPGDKAWVPALGAAGGKVKAVKCPNGKDDATPAEP